MLCSKRYLKVMAEFRELYVPAGAASNFLAKHILWADTVSVESSYNANSFTNEFFYHREKVDGRLIDTVSFEKFRPTERIHTLTYTLIPLLEQLDEFISNAHYPHGGQRGSDGDLRESLRDNINVLWLQDASMYTSPYLNFQNFIVDSLPSEVRECLTKVEDCFAEFREYYYQLCELNSYKSFIISHKHPKLSISPRIKLPDTFKTLAVTIDKEVDMVLFALLDIKQGEIKDEYSMMDQTEDELFLNKSAMLSDETVSYKKIFFENDESEIRKMFDFFDNGEYFDNNKVHLIQEFKNYNDNNMNQIKTKIPHLKFMKDFIIP